MTLKNAVVTTFAVLWFGSAVANADVVLDWNNIMVTTVSGQNPFAQARFAAITQLAVFEAVNAVTGQYTPYLGTDQRAPGLVRGGGGNRGRTRRIEELLSCICGNPGRAGSQIACLHPGWAGEGKRYRSGRGCGESHDSRPDE